MFQVQQSRFQESTLNFPVNLMDVFRKSNRSDIESHFFSPTKTVSASQPASLVRRFQFFICDPTHPYQSLTGASSARNKQMGELPKRTSPVHDAMKLGTYSKIAKSSGRTEKAFRSYAGFNTSQKAGSKPSKAAGSSFLSMSSGGDKADGDRRRKRSDGSIASVNRFGKVWNYVQPPRSRPSFEANLSPIIEDAQSFPCLDDRSSTFDTFSTLGGRGPEQNRSTGRHQDPVNDSRNFDHMNLSGSFVLQSASRRDIRSCDDVADKDQRVPALVLTFPTPEQPNSSRFAAQSGSNLQQLVVSATPSSEICGQRGNSSLALATFPGPLRLPCKSYQAQGNSVRRAECNKGLGLEAVDELDRVPTEGHATAVREVYSRFSNVVIKDKTSTQRTAKLWKKATRLFTNRDRRN
ncbi:hypothetical protein GGX14DRAFT_647261 [Mycena pura]|uniref:Uncharacterized protein n=1 Tax=Mycena pura TaxID=153505 RepID=A0AAD6Y9X4_9AGAR|nr:hypothetical protein GGX14DRAFT_647261 [Mycena pura]